MIQFKNVRWGFLGNLSHHLIKHPEVFPTFFLRSPNLLVYPHKPLSLLKWWLRAMCLIFHLVLTKSNEPVLSWHWGKTDNFLKASWSVRCGTPTEVHALNCTALCTLILPILDIILSERIGPFLFPQACLLTPTFSDNFYVLKLLKSTASSCASVYCACASHSLVQLWVPAKPFVLPVYLTAFHVEFSKIAFHQLKWNVAF